MSAPGPVQRAVWERLRGWGGAEAAVAVAERSPIGARALRVGFAIAGPSSKEACRSLAEWLDGQPWAERVVAVPPNVYLQPSLDALRTWAASSLAASAPEAGGAAVVRFADADALSPCPLDILREAAVGRAIAALLRTQGLSAACEPTQAAAGTAFREQGCIALSLPDGPAEAAVAGVDLPQGPLRARHGGTVSAEDLVQELRRGAAGAGGFAPGRALREASALAGFLMLRTERTRRLQLDEAKLAAEAAVFDSILAARGPGDQALAPAVGADERALRELIMELDLLPGALERAARGFEPAHLARQLKAMAERAQAACPRLAPADPLWAVLRATIDRGLAALGLEISPALASTPNADTRLEPMLISD